MAEVVGERFGKGSALRFGDAVGGIGSFGMEYGGFGGPGKGRGEDQGEKV